MNTLGDDRPNELRLASMEKSRNASAVLILKVSNFRRTGFSGPTIDALWAAGVQEPEALVHLSDEQIQKIPGVGKARFKAICVYRDRFRPRV